ncbi:glycosyltransferase family 2 protein [Paenibacillus sp. FSL F4-0236]|uniref:glycosyltransferase family 2 protein n=1 Tax=Paenibacillus sp. FSL F4-0236 TaxID=2954731 RepID=UPI0030F6EF48
MDIIYDSKVINSINPANYHLDSDHLVYLREMSECLTNISIDIYNNLKQKTEDMKISDVLKTAAAFKTLKSVTVSAIIICFNEEKLIRRCIESIQPCNFDEIIVVDTGSTDNTLQILQSLQERMHNLHIYAIQWEDDFAKARNFGLNLAESDWVFFIDADEYYLEQEKYNVKELISFYSIYYNGNLCVCPNIVNSNKHELYNNPRIFRKNSGYQYYGNVHEMLRNNKDSYEFVPYIGLNIKFGHDGYLKDVYSHKNKEKRNIDLLIKCIESEPDNPLWKCYLVRDGVKKLSADSKIQLCKDTIDLCEGIETYFCTYNYYWAHTLLIDLYVDMKEVNKAVPLLNELKKNTLGWDESDIYYREQLVYMLKVEKELEAKLTEVKNYRKQHLNTKGSMLNTQGYHLDELIMRLNYLNHNMDEYHQYKDHLYHLHYFV